MKCQTTTSSIPTINKDKRIGTVVIFLEGEQTEIQIFQKIFHDILGYKPVTIRRRGKKVFTHTVNLKPDVGNSANIFLFNLRKPQVKAINDYRFRDDLYKEVLLEYGIDLKNKPVYYVWDRDPGSNSAEDTRALIERLGSANGNTMANPKQDYENGLLILSYPAAESYIISHLKPVKFVSNTSLKTYVKQEKMRIRDFSQDGLIKAVHTMHRRMEGFGISSYDTDSFSGTHLSLYEDEEKVYKSKGDYLIFSLISVILVDLGILNFRTPRLSA